MPHLCFEVQATWMKINGKEWMNGQKIGGWMDGWVDGWIYRLMDHGWIERWADNGWIDVVDVLSYCNTACVMNMSASLGWPFCVANSTNIKPNSSGMLAYRKYWRDFSSSISMK